MKEPSRIYESWDIVVVPFPFTEKLGEKRRPAMVVSQRLFNKNGHTVLAMITTQSHTPWPGDTFIQTGTFTGLPAACLVRLKLFTLDNRLILKKIGMLSLSDRKNVVASFYRYMPFEKEKMTPFSP
ncbi:MAG: type II toxin-antitoxin system PemK/MazF family toxin [Nitrospirota bacterium]